MSSTKSMAKSVTDSNSNLQQEVTTKYRWAAEFLAGPGGYMEKEEIVSDWFPNIIDAKKDALSKAEREVQDYPYSRGRILKLIVEDSSGSVTEISNVKHNVPLR